MIDRLKHPTLLYTYLATEMLAPFFASFIILNSVFLLVKLIPLLNFVLQLQISMADFIRFFCYLFPKIMLYTTPMSALMGVTIGFTRLSTDSEILAFKASGVSMYQIIPPVILVTAVIALFATYISIQLIPRSEIAMKHLTYQLMKEKVDKGIKTNSFTEALGDVVVYVEDVDKVTGQWHNVWVSDMRGVENPIITMASRGKMISDIEKMNVTIVLENGSLHRPSTDHSEIIQFGKYSIIIPLKLPHSKETSIKRRHAFGMKELLAASKNKQETTKQKRLLLMEFHKRLALPAGCLLLSILGLPLGLQARPGRKANGIQAGIGLFILYYFLYTMGKYFAEQGSVPVALGIWAPNCFFLCLAIFWLYRLAIEKPLLPRFR